jgi:hypothetical protein
MNIDIEVDDINNNLSFSNNFDKFNFRSLDGVDITWDLHNEHFIQYYREIMLYIDNRN